MIDLYSLNNTTKEILAFAVKEVFPNAEFLQGEASDIDFYYDFYFPYPICEEFLSLVQERMRDIIDKQLIIEHKEMLASNAIGYLNHLKLTKRAQTLQLIQDRLVDLFLMGDYIDLCIGPFEKEVKNIKYFKIYSAYFVKSSHLRILGTASNNKENLKEQVKKNKNYESNNHLVLGEKHNLFFREKENFIWLHQGVVLKDRIYEFWKEIVIKEKFELFEAPLNYLYDYALEKSHPRCAQKFLKENKGEVEGLLQTGNYTTLKEYVFCEEEKLLQNCISSLQFILKIIKIFDFTLEVVLLGKGKEKRTGLLQKALDMCSIEYEAKSDLQPAIICKVADNLNRKWPLSYIKIKSLLLEKKKLFYSKGQAYIERSSIGSIERFLALLIEKTDGNIGSILEKLNRSNFLLEN